MRPRTLFFLIGLVIAPMLAGCQTESKLRLGNPLPVMRLSDVNGRFMTLPDDVRGKVTLIRFWSIVCPSCSKELLKTLEEFHQKYQSQGFMAVSINVDPPEEANQEARKLGYIHYPFLVDPGRKATEALGLRSLPITLILDEKGVMREIVKGDAPPDMFEELLTKVLHKRGNYDY